MTSQLPVCVIGAGPSGLAAAKHLADRDIDFAWYDIGSALGGVWRYDNDNGRSPAYASLHIDTSKERFAFADLPMPKAWPSYLHHTQVLEYLEHYADTFDLTDRLSTRHQVTRVAPEGDAWLVTVRDLDADEESTERHRAVVVANGHHWLPNMPETDPTFAGSVMHAQAYRTPEPFIGKHVVVVGVGNTGVDIAADLTWHAASVTLSARSGAHVLPRFVLGRPLDTWSTRASSKLPLSIQRTAYRALLFMARGRQESYGFPQPDGPLLSQHPTVSQDILRLVKSGQVTVAPSISRMNGNDVVFTDGASVRCDVIVYATGYRIAFPFLDDELLPVAGNRVDLYRRVVPPDVPGLYFVGLIQPLGALPPLAEQQARWVAQLIEGAPLPTQAAMRAEIIRYRERLAHQYADRPRHTIQVDYWPYLEEMSAVCDENDRSVAATSV